jgi:hypothetical protein
MRKAVRPESARFIGIPRWNGKKRKRAICEKRTTVPVAGTRRVPHYPRLE